MYLRDNKKGTTIVESIVAISLVSLFVLIFSASYVAIATSQSIKHKNLAYNLALEEIEVLRDIPFTSLSNRSNTDFIEVIYNTGDWQVIEKTGTPSTPNTLKLFATESNPAGITGLMAVPGFEYKDFNYSTEIFVDPSSPANWETGIYARYHDIDNYYSVYFTSTNLYLKKSVAGVESTLISKAKSFSKGVWYNLKIFTSTDSFEVFIDDVSELTTTDSGNSFSQGRLALFGKNSVTAYFDDVVVTTTGSVTWNFDSDETQELPNTWLRFGINDLPNGATKLTITDKKPGFTDLKEVTARVEWTERGNTKSSEITTLITTH